MEAQQFQALVARVEQMAEADPRGYVLRVFGIAALGFAILGLVIAMAMVNVALIAGVVLLVVFTGGKALLFIAKLGKLVILHPADGIDLGAQAAACQPRAVEGSVRQTGQTGCL